MLARLAVKIRRWLPILALAAFGAGAIACAVDGDLNPQPLPPGPEDTKDGTSSGGTSSGTGGGGESSGFATGGTSGGASSGGSSSGAGDLGANPTPYSDAGSSFDAGDGDASAK